MLKGVVPGKYLEYLWTVAGLCAPVPTKMFVASSDWAWIAREVKARQPIEIDGTPTPQNFNELLLPYDMKSSADKGEGLLVINARSERQDAIDEANQQDA